MRTSTTAVAARYVYGIVWADAADGIEVTGVGDPPTPLEAVRHGRVAALVSPVAERHDVQRADVFAHARVLEAVSERTAVLPMRFGMTLPAPDAVVDELLAPHHDHWAALLDEFGGAVELRVRAFHDQDAILRQVVRESPEVQELAGSRDPGERVRLGQIVAEGLDRHREADADRLIAALAPLARDVRRDEPSVEGMVLDAAFLVDRDAALAFDREVAALGDETGDRLRLRCLGPQAPYTFVTAATGG